MKERYRSMMEQAVLSEEAKADLLEKLERKCPAKKGVRVLRAALIAACACVVLIGGTFAAEYISNAGIVEFEVEMTPEVELDTENWSGYQVRFETLKNFSLNEFSEEFTAWYASMKTTGSDNVVEFDSWDDLEQFLGLELMNNSVLEQAEKRTVELKDKNGDLMWERHCYGRFGGRGGDGQCNGANVEAFYDCLGGDVHVFATIETEASLLHLGDPVFGMYYSKSYYEKMGFQTEQYVAPSGLAATIVEGPNGRYAYFALNGVAFYVHYTGPIDSNAIYQILEAFEF